MAVLALELRLESRYGLHAAGVGLAVLWTLLLLAMPADAARIVTPFVLFADSATVGGFLLAAMVLFERNERTLAAMLITPVTSGEYLAAKVAALTGLALLIAAPVAAAGGRGDLRPGPVLAGVTLTAALLLACCFALVARHHSITSFLSAAPWPLIPLLGVPLARLAGLSDHPGAYLIPTVAAAELIASGFDPDVHVPAAAIGYLLACVAAAGVLAARRFTAAVRAQGG
jgi:fluoroquinolone transport system permease protein